MTGVEARVERFAAMGTRVEVHVFGAGDEDALARARRAIEAVDDALTIHRPSAATAMNERLTAGRDAAIDNPVLLAALGEVDALVTTTGGLFDPSAGAGRWESIDFSAGAARISASRSIALDFGGFGKGYALDLATRALRDAGVTSAFLSAGESSIAVVGRHPLGARWPVGIPHPFDPARFLVELELEDEAVSISSTASADANSPGRSATVRPATGEAIAQQRTAIAIEPTGALAEAMSTALLIADDAERAGLASRNQGQRFVFRFEDREAIPLISKQDFSQHVR